MADPADSAISSSLRLTKALGLARQGKLKSAQQLLAPNDAVPANTLELHALAALVTHEGDYARALRFWQLLLEREPGHPEARRMIPMIELWQSRPAWQRYVPLGLGTLAVVILGVVVLWAVNTFSAPSPVKPVGSSQAAPVITPAPSPVQPATPAPAPIRIAPSKNQKSR
jgi:hypothetical protein